MTRFTFQRLNRWALGICILMLLSALVLALGDPAFYWISYVILAVGGIGFWVLFHAYQRKVSDFFDEVNKGMEQMLATRGEARLPEVEDPENVFARFVSKLSRLYDALRIAEAGAEEEKRVMQGMIADLSHQIKTPVANIKMDLELLSARRMPRKSSRNFWRGHCIRRIKWIF